MKFLWSRLNKSWLLLALFVGLSLSFLQIINGVSRVTPFDSPYTKWLGIDPFTFLPIVFFILLPLIASIPASVLLKDDFTNGLFYKLKMEKSVKHILYEYVNFSFIAGFFVIAVSLLVNFITWFMILLNIRPDNLLNKNIAALNLDVLFVSLYYAHPFIHGILSILFASAWSGIFSVIVTVSSLWLKNRFVAMCSGLILQIGVMLINKILPLANFISYSPADFLREEANSNVSLLVVGIVTMIAVLYCMIMFHLDEKRLVEL